MEEEVSMKKEEVIKKKRGRRPKDYKFEYQVNKEQTKFFVDLSKDKKAQLKIINLLEQVNKKDYGKIITFKDVSLYALEKLSTKDVEKIKEESLSEMERVQKSLDDYNQKNNSTLTLGEYLVRQLKIT